MTDEAKDKFLQWLETEYGKSYDLLSRHMRDDDEQVKCEVLEMVLAKYRECKEQAGHVLTAEQAEVLEGVASATTIIDNIPSALFDTGMVVLVGTNWHITDTGRAALKTYRERHND